jgi:hypothetical protein
MNRFLILGPLVVVWLVGLLVLMGSKEVPSVPFAHAGSYLTLDRCRTALRGADGSDNDVLFELRRLNARRWGWGEALRVDHRTVVQVIRRSRRIGTTCIRCGPVPSPPSLRAQRDSVEEAQASVRLGEAAPLPAAQVLPREAEERSVTILLVLVIAGFLAATVLFVAMAVFTLRRDETATDRFCAWVDAELDRQERSRG